MNLVECVPNFSEGRRPEVVSAIANAIAGAKSITVLDVSSDHSHNRSVITFVAPPDTVVEAAFAGIRTALELIDLNAHTGEHPRIGAADVVPFVPMEGVTMDECIELAKALGERVGRELGIPVYLYERAATRPERTNLANVRKGNFEGLREAILNDPVRAPDYGPSRVHPTFGAVAIGARPVLVAYNVYIGGAGNLAIAKQVATAVRESSGGLPAVKAMGLLVDDQAQVSMNLVDIDRTPLHRAFEAVKAEAEARGAQVTWSEIVGLVPERALIDTGAAAVQLDKFSDAQVLERRLREAQTHEPTVRGFLADLASASPAPGGGTAAAHSGAVAASLVHMVATLTLGKKKYAAVAAEMQQIADEARALADDLRALGDADAAAYSAVADAYRTYPRGDDAANAARARAVDAALMHAAAVPLATAEKAARVCELAAAAAQRGNTNAVSDAAVAALLAEAACAGAVFNIRVNVALLQSPSEGTVPVAAGHAAERRAHEATVTVRDILSQQL